MVDAAHQEIVLIGKAQLSLDRVSVEFVAGWVRSTAVVCGSGWLVLLPHGQDCGVDADSARIDRCQGVLCASVLRCNDALFQRRRGNRARVNFGVRKAPALVEDEGVGLAARAIWAGWDHPRQSRTCCSGNRPVERKHSVVVLPVVGTEVVVEIILVAGGHATYWYRAWW